MSGTRERIARSVNRTRTRSSKWRRNITINSVSCFLKNRLIWFPWMAAGKPAKSAMVGCYEEFFVALHMEVECALLRRENGDVSLTRGTPARAIYRGFARKKKERERESKPWKSGSSLRKRAQIPAFLRKRFFDVNLRFSPITFLIHPGRIRGERREICRDRE